jgi:hypothetical protein
MDMERACIDLQLGPEFGDLLAHKRNPTLDKEKPPLLAALWVARSASAVCNA